MSGSPISYLSGPQDPSQIDATINGVITQINGVLTGQTSASSVTAQSTAVNIPGYGAVTVNSTTRTAGTTGRYTIAAPVNGHQQIITSLSTVQATITGLFSRGRTKITLKSTAALSAGGQLASVILRAISTSAWSVSASHGNATCT